MARWRKIKSKSKDIKNNQTKTKIIETDFSQNASFLPRFKAQVVDTFMLYMPLLYIIAYFILGDSQSFRDSNLAPFSAIFIYSMISTIFVYKTGQTPGKRAYDIKIVDEKTGENLSFIKSLLRFIVFMFSSSILLGVIISFFRDDKKMLQDLVVGSKVILIDE